LLEITAPQRAALWVAAVIFLSVYYLRFLKGAGLQVFTDAAQCMLHGDTPLHCKGVIFAYPPLFALLSTVLLAMPPWLRDVFWYLTLVGTMFASMRLCEVLALRLFPGQWTEKQLAWLRVLSFVLPLKFVLAVFENQAYDSISFVFIPLGLLLLGKGHWMRGAASLAVAASLKVTPLIFLPYLLFKRRFAGAAVFATIVVVLSALPDILIPPHVGTHIGVWLREMLFGPFASNPLRFALPFWVTDSPMNQSFHAAVARMIDELGEPKLFEMTYRGIVLIYVACVGAIMLKSVRDDRLIAVDGALLVISGLLMSPVSSQSHFVGLMLPYALLAAAFIRDASRRLFYFVTGRKLCAGNGDVERWRWPGFTGCALKHNLSVWGTLLLVVPLGVSIWSVRASEPAEVAPLAAAGAASTT
jgi:hypothetical protein